MAKKFYTERDIEDLYNRGQMTLEMCEDVVLTELAFEKAERLGLKLLQPHQLPPAAPVRPYLSQPVQVDTKPCECCEKKSLDDEEMRQRIRDSVKAKLGNQIDSALLETIITRVLNNVGVK
jgi:hypothetical protein